MDTQVLCQRPCSRKGKRLIFIKYFRWDEKSSCWRLKTPEHCQKDSGCTPKDDRKVRLPNLNQLLYLQPWRFELDVDKVAELSDRGAFVDVVKDMLQLDPSIRRTAKNILLHKFFNLSHLNAFKSCTYVQRASSTMGSHLHNKLFDSGAGQTKTGGSEEGTAEFSRIQQKRQNLVHITRTSPKTLNLNITEQAAGERHVLTAGHPNCTSGTLAQRDSQVRSVVKRKN
ncbi:hypothetical protein WMY93_016706 [Mugilogobius chulae]|uniref:Protein kinase domain-containing protein n=1 Tax=Mugilogobius chulae TaxID=88201 RepID=A0AAW0NYB6_9GOBI